MMRAIVPGGTLLLRAGTPGDCILILFIILRPQSLSIGIITMLSLLLFVSAATSSDGSSATTNTNLVPVSGWQLPHPTVPLQTKQHEIHGSMSY